MILGHSFRVLSIASRCPQVLRTLRLLSGDASSVIRQLRPQVENPYNPCNPLLFIHTIVELLDLSKHPSLWEGLGRLKPFENPCNPLLFIHAIVELHYLSKHPSLWEGLGRLKPFENP